MNKEHHRMCGANWGDKCNCAVSYKPEEHRPSKEWLKGEYLPTGEQRTSNPQCGHTPLYMQSPVRWAERVEPCLYCRIADLTAELAGYKAALLERLDKVLAGDADETFAGPPCGCGQPEKPGIEHRRGGPCYGKPPESIKNWNPDDGT